MKFKKNICLLCAGIAFTIGMILLFLLASHKPFPMWEEAQERPVRDDVSMTFVELESKKKEDIIVVHLKNEGGERLCADPPFSIDYLKDGIWYTVCKISCVPGPSSSLGLERYGTCDVEIPVPKGLLRTQGTYRVYLDYVGFCDIESDGKKNISMSADGPYCAQGRRAEVVRVSPGRLGR